MKYVIKNVNLYQGKIDSQIQPHSNVYFEDGIIVKIDQALEVAANYQVIDGTDKYLLPGLINLHVHLFGSGKPSKVLGGQSQLQQMIIKAASTKVGTKVLDRILVKNVQDALKSGVTTIRSVGDFFYRDVALRDRIKKGEISGPDLIVSGPAITVSGGHGDKTFAITGNTQEELIACVNQNVEQGVDLIKICITGGVMDAKVKGEPGEVKMSYEQAKWVCDAAHEKGMIVASHTESPKGVEIAVDAGVDTIEHGSLFDEKIAHKCKVQNTAFVCTLSPALPLANFSPSLTKLDELCVYNSKVVLENMIDGVRKALGCYIPVGLGTDASCPYATQYNMWREVCYFAKYLNVSNSFALYTATLQNAIILKMEDKIGSIEVGKHADMFMVKNDPLQDLKALKDVELVVAKGKIIDQCHIDKNADIEQALDTLL
ncbi:MAG: amidohydrolase family protein [Erysipelotrichaceae bacterium]|nr:amidohydrolase family protein [Erysipelotrichaceae bacterium]MDY5252097.1 amidohydrolase family protein [Erysipelotrichaceae bacterium]